MSMWFVGSSSTSSESGFRIAIEIISFLSSPGLTAFMSPCKFSADKAKQILKDAGFAARIDEVIAVVVPDAVGSLAKVVAMIHAAGINISYIYGLSIDGEGAPIAIKTNDNAKAEAILNAAGVKTMGMEDLQ